MVSFWGRLNEGKCKLGMAKFWSNCKTRAACMEEKEIKKMKRRERERDELGGGHVESREKKPAFKSWHGFNKNAARPIIFLLFQTCPIINTACLISCSYSKPESIT